MIPKRANLNTLTPAQLSEYATLHAEYIASSSAIADHQAWHGRHGSGSDAHFLHWHRYYLRQLENFLGSRGAHHLAPIPYWPSNTPIPAELPVPPAGAGDPPSPVNMNPNVTPPSWTTMDGGATASPVGSHTALGQFVSSAELGGAIGFGYHGAVHNGIGGRMAGFASPEAAIFYPWHGYVDRIWAEWQRRCMPPATVIVRGAQGRPNGEAVRINLFVRRNDGNLWERYWNGTSWTWSDTGRSVFGRAVALVRGDAEDVAADDLRINLFVQGSDRKLWERYWNGSSWSWSDTGKEVDGEPLVLGRGALATPDAANIRINLFVRGADGRLWERYWNGGAWSWSDTGKDVAGQPVAVVRGDVEDTAANDLRINLFVRGADSRLWERYWNGSAWSWSDTGKDVSDDPVVLVRGNQGSPDPAQVRIHVWVRGTDGKLWERYWNGSAWSWSDTGRGVRGRAVPLLRGNARSVAADDIRINLFAQGTDGKLWERYWSGSAWSWSDSGLTCDGEPTLLVRGNVQSVDARDVRIHVFTPVLEAASSGGSSAHPHYDTVLWERFWDGAGWTAVSTGLKIRTPSVAFVRGDSEDTAPDDLRINLFVTGDDGSLWERYWSGSAWSTANTGGTVPL